MSRGNGKMPIFLDDHDYRKFIDVLADVVEDGDIECWNYCLMPNHYHVTFRPTRPNLSQAVRRLNGAYALWWNHRHGRVGHVFQGRFKAQIVDRETYLFALSRYVVMNPVRARLVDRPEAWSWSSYRATVGLCRAPAFLATDRTLALFDDLPGLSHQERFAQFVIAPEDVTEQDRIRSNERVLGPKAFKQQVKSQSELEVSPETAGLPEETLE